MDWETIICLLAGAYNVSLLVVTRAFTHKEFFDIDPNLFDKSGCIMVLLWGGVHISVAWSYASVPFLFLVFALEKLFYVVQWILWIRKRATWIDKVRETDINTYIFFHAYGILDALFFGPALLTIFIMNL